MYSILPIILVVPVAVERSIQFGMPEDSRESLQETYLCSVTGGRFGAHSMQTSRKAEGSRHSKH